MFSLRKLSSLVYVTQIRNSSCTKLSLDGLALCTECLVVRGRIKRNCGRSAGDDGSGTRRHNSTTAEER